MWFDKWEIKVGESITWKIEEGLRENDYLVLVLSPEALASEWVKTEISGAWFRQMSTKKIVVLPILYRQCEIPLFLADRKYADFRTDYQQGLSELLATFGIKNAELLSEDNWRLFMGDRSADWQAFRKKEYKKLVTVLVDRAKEYHWSWWVGASKNPLSITCSAVIDRDKAKYVSICMCKGEYLASYQPEVNPNRLQACDYNIYVGNSVNECEEFLWRHMEDFKKQYGNPPKIEFGFTGKFLNNSEKSEVIRDVMQTMDWYQYKK